MRALVVSLLLLLSFAPRVVLAQYIFGRLTPPHAAVEPNGASDDADVSGNGKTAVFASGATNWLAVPTTGNRLFAYDLVEDAVEQLSLSGLGAALNGTSFTPAVSHDGTRVAFATLANNLDVGIATSGTQIVLRDRSAQTLTLVSANASGVAAAGSASGQARDPALSGNGRFVAFRSDAPNLVAGDSGSSEDVFVKDVQLGRTGAVELVSGDLTGAFTGNTLALTRHAISHDGRFVTFASAAGNLVAGVGSGTIHVYVRDRVAGSTELISRNAAGIPAGSQSDTASISPSGRFVAFRSFASNLTGTRTDAIYVRDRLANTVVAVPRPVLAGTEAIGCRENDVSDFAEVAMTCFFGAAAKDQVYLHLPGIAGTPFLISDNAGAAGNEISGASVAIDADGRSVVFASRASDLVAGDVNGNSDVFVLVDAVLLDTVFADGFE